MLFWLLHFCSYFIDTWRTVLENVLCKWIWFFWRNVICVKCAVLIWFLMQWRSCGSGLRTLYQATSVAQVVERRHGGPEVQCSNLFFFSLLVCFKHIFIVIKSAEYRTMCSNNSSKNVWSRVFTTLQSAISLTVCTKIRCRSGKWKSKCEKNRRGKEWKKNSVLKNLHYCDSLRKCRK